MSDDSEPIYDASEPVHPHDVVHKDDLRELVEEWREGVGVGEGTEYQTGYDTAKSECADDLEELIDD